MWEQPPQRMLCRPQSLCPISGQARQLYIYKIWYNQKIIFLNKRWTWFQLSQVQSIYRLNNLESNWWKMQNNREPHYSLEKFISSTTFSPKNWYHVHRQRSKKNCILAPLFNKEFNLGRAFLLYTSILLPMTKQNRMDSAGVSSLLSLFY